MGLIEHIYIEYLREHVACWVAMQDANEPIEADEGKQSWPVGSFWLRPAMRVAPWSTHQRDSNGIGDVSCGRTVRNHGQSSPWYSLPYRFRGGRRPIVQ
jgi:hypothetical protein